MALLFDFYGDLLTERQREFYDLYYNEDLSLAEIAENYGISRQGVRDVIVRAEAAMTEIEDKTHIIRRFQRSQAALDAIDKAADRLLDAFSESPDMPAEHLHRALARLESQRQALREQRRRDAHRPLRPERLCFSELTFPEKKAVAALFIRRIDVGDDTAEIVWNV